MNMISAIPELRNDLYCYYPVEESDFYSSDSALGSVQWWGMPFLVQQASCLNKTKNKIGERQELHLSSELQN